MADLRPSDNQAEEPFAAGTAGREEPVRLTVSGKGLATTLRVARTTGDVLPY
jgi:hypothetical protein